MKLIKFPSVILQFVFHFTRGYVRKRQELRVIRAGVRIASNDDLVVKKAIKQVLIRKASYKFTQAPPFEDLFPVMSLETILSGYGEAGANAVAYIKDRFKDGKVPVVINRKVYLELTFPEYERIVFEKCKEAYI